MKNTIIIFLLLCSIKGFSQVPITRTLSNVNNTADSLKPVSKAQATINTSLQSSIATHTANIATNTANIVANITANTENVVFASVLSSYVVPEVGNGTLTYTRVLDVTTLNANGTYSDNGTNVPTYTFNPLTSKNRYKSTRPLANLFSDGYRNLSRPNWTATNITATYVEIGLDGVASTASRLTSTTANATILASYTVSSSTRTFSAFVKRISGSGRIWMTQNGGTTYKDITTQLNESTFSRVFVTSTVTNPNCGFMMETSGDIIAVDGVGNFAISYLIDPLLVNAFQVYGSTLTIDNINPLITGKIYMVKAKMKITGELQNVQIGTTTNGIRFTYISSDKSFSVASWSNGVLQYNTGTSNVLLYQNDVTNIGNEVEIMIIFGNSTVKIYKNNQLMYVYDDATKKEPIASMTKIEITGDAEYSDLTISELPTKNVILLGDSFTAMDYYKKMWHNKLKDRYKEFSIACRGEGGNTINDVIARVSTQVSTAVVSSNKNTCVLWIGTNSLASGVSATTALSQLSTLIANLKATGITKVLCISTAKRGGAFSNGITSTSFEVQRLLYNAGIKAAGADDVLDLDSLNFSELSDTSNTLYWDAIQVHILPTVYEKIFPFILQKL